MKEIRRSLIFTFAERYTTLAINLVSTALLARLLTPREFGIFGVAAAIVMLVNTMREFGVGTYLIQKADLSQDSIRTAFTITLVLSVLLAAGLILLSNPAASFYGDEGVRNAITVSALGFLLLPVPVTILGLLRRDMAFGSVALCNVATVLVTAVTSVGLAALGVGFMSPVWGSLAGGGAAAIVAFSLRPDFGMFRPCLRDWRGVITFGGFSSANSLINVFYDSAPQLILGRVLDFTAVGLYTRALTVSQLFDKAILDALQPVLMPAISAKVRLGGDVKVAFLRGIEYISALQWPSLLFLALMAEPIVALLFGPNWSAITPLVRFIALASLALFGARLVYPVLTATGHVRDTMILSMISVPLSLAIIFGASFFGITAVAASTLIIAPMQAANALLFIRRRVSFNMKELCRSVHKSALIAIVTVIGPIGLRYSGILQPEDPLLELIAAGSIAGVGWCAAIFATRHPLADELRYITAKIRHIRRPPYASQTVR